MSIRDEQVDEIVWSALQREPRDREEFLKKVCAGDEALLFEAASLVAADARVQADGFLLEPILGDTHPEKQHDPLIGQHIHQYEITRKIEAGGSGNVFLARDRKLGRQVALKFLLKELTISKEHVRRFKREAQATSALNHPNILTVYEIGEINSQYFIAAEYVDGETLRDRLSDSPLDVAEAIRIAIQVANALAAAHKENIIHRDVKPENIMIRADGYVKVLDFGIAKMTADSTQRHMNKATDQTETDTLSSTDGIIGTIRYMSPEQTRRQDVDKRTDIWSLGVVLYEMTVGHPPFEGNDVSEIIHSIRKTTPRSLREMVEGVPSELQRIVSKALAKNKKGRYQSVHELRNDLDKLRIRLSHRRRNRILLWSGVAATILLGVLVFVGESLYTQRSREALTHDLIAEALALRKDRPDRLQTSALLTLEAYKRQPSAEIYQIIYESLSVLPKMMFQIRDDEFVYSADGKKLLTGGEDGTVKFWDVGTNQEINEFKLEAAILKLATTSDGKYLAVQVRDKSKPMEDKVIIVDAASGQQVGQLQKPCWVGDLVFAPNSYFLATTDSCGDFRAARLWSVPDGVQIFEFVHAHGIPSKVVFSPDSQYLSTVADFPGQKMEIHVWNTQTGREIRMPDPADLNNVEFSPAGKYMALLRDQIVEFVDLESLRTVGRVNQKETVNTMTFSPDGKYLATSNEPDDVTKENGSSTLLVYEVPSGRQIGHFNNEDHSHFAVFSSDSKYIASCSYSPIIRDRKDMVRVWDLSSGSEMARVVGDTLGRAIFSPDDKYIITGGADLINNPFNMSHENELKSGEQKVGSVGMIRGWDLVSRPLKTRTFVTEPTPWRHYAVSGTGKYFAASMEEEDLIHVWDLSSSRVICLIRSSGKNLTLTISDDGRFIAANSEVAIGAGTYVEVWNTETQQKVLSRYKKEWVPRLELSYDGSYLAEMDRDVIRLVNVKTNKESAVLRHYDEDIKSMAFSPTSGSIITGGGSALQVWDVRTGQSLSKINNTGDISYLSYSRDGQFIVAVKSMSGLMTVYRVKDGHQIMSIQHDTNNIFGAQFSSDGKYVLTYESPYSEDGRLHIFELATGQEIARMTKNGGAFFSDDGLLVVFNDGIFSWERWQPRDILSEACARLTTNLTEREWQRYLPNETFHKTCENLP